MAKSIEINDLASAIAKELESYNADVEIMVDEETQSLAKQVVQDFKNDDSIPKRTGNYKKGFYMKKYGVKSKRRGYVIANKEYQITHLLEHGHITRNGKRTRAFPHWTQANQTVQNLAINIRKRLEGGRG